MTTAELIKAFNSDDAQEVFNDLVQNVQDAINGRIFLNESEKFTNIYLNRNGTITYFPEDKANELVYSVEAYTPEQREEVVLGGSSWTEELKLHEPNLSHEDMSEEEAKRLCEENGILDILLDDAFEYAGQNNPQYDDTNACILMKNWLESKGLEINWNNNKGRYVMKEVL